MTYQEIQCNNCFTVVGKIDESQLEEEDKTTDWDNIPFFCLKCLKDIEKK